MTTHPVEFDMYYSRVRPQPHPKKPAIAGFAVISEGV